MFESQKRDPDSSASWKEKMSLCVCYKIIISFRTIYENRCSYFVPTSAFEVSLVRKSRRHPTRGAVLGRFTARPGEIIDFLDQSEFLLSFPGLSLRTRDRQGHSPQGHERWNVIHHHHDQLLTRDQRGSSNHG